jgi:hypothetical protein
VREDLPLALGALLLVAALLAGCSSLDLRTMTRADLDAARQIALAHDDTAGVACAEALTAALPAERAMVRPAGAFSTFMLARQLRRGREQGMPESARTACAPLIVDGQRTMITIASWFAPGGGLVARLLGR